MLFGAQSASRCAKTPQRRWQNIAQVDILPPDGGGKRLRLTNTCVWSWFGVKDTFYNGTMVKINAWINPTVETYQNPTVESGHPSWGVIRRLVLSYKDPTADAINPMKGVPNVPRLALLKLLFAKPVNGWLTVLEQ